MTSARTSLGSAQNTPPVILTESPLARTGARVRGVRMPGWKGNKVPTLKERKKSSSDRTFEIMGEDMCSFVKWENTG